MPDQLDALLDGLTPPVSPPNPSRQSDPLDDMLSGMSAAQPVPPGLNQRRGSGANIPGTLLPDGVWAEGWQPAPTGLTQPRGSVAAGYNPPKPGESEAEREWKDDDRQFYARGGRIEGVDAAGKPVARGMAGAPLPSIAMSIPGAEKTGLPGVPRPSVPGLTAPVATQGPFAGQPLPDDIDTSQEFLPNIEHIAHGISRAAQGTPSPTQPANPKELAGGAAEALGGAMGAAAPAGIFVGLETAPLKTFLTAAASMGAGIGTEKGLKALGVPDEYSDFAGTIAALLAGYATLKSLSPEQKALVEEVRGNDAPGGAAGSSTRIDALMNTAERGGSENERMMAQQILKTKYGIIYQQGTAPGGAATAADAAARSAGTTGAPEATAQPPAAAQPPATSPQPPAPSIGDVVPYQDGTARISSISPNGIVNWEHTSAAGVVERHATPAATWQSIAGQSASAAGTPNAEAQAPTVPPAAPQAPLTTPTAPTGQPEPSNAHLTPQPPQPPAVSGAEAAQLPGAVPQGNGPGILPGLSGAGAGQPSQGQSGGGGLPGPAPLVAPKRETEDIITGNVDQPLTPGGQADAGRLAQKTTDATSIETTPLIRGQQTAQTIASQASGVEPRVNPALAPWDLGDFAGQRQSEVDGQINHYIEHPDQTVPGGESFNDFRGRLISGVQEAIHNWQAGEKPVLVTHSIGVHTVQAWMANGAPQDGAVSTQAMLQRQKMAPAALFYVDPRQSPVQMVPAENTAKDGVYLARHADTAWDNVAKVGAQPAVSPEKPVSPSQITLTAPKSARTGDISPATSGGNTNTPVGNTIVSGSQPSGGTPPQVSLPTPTLPAGTAPTRESGGVGAETAGLPPPQAPSNQLAQIKPNSTNAPESGGGVLSTSTQQPPAPSPWRELFGKYQASGASEAEARALTTRKLGPEPEPARAPAFNQRMAEFARRLQSIASSHDMAALRAVTSEMEAYRNKGGASLAVDAKILNAAIEQAHSTLRRVQASDEAVASLKAEQDARPIARLTPRPGTPERTKLDAEYKQANEASEAITEKVIEMQRARDKTKPYSKIHEKLEEKVSKLKAAEAAAWEAFNKVRGPSYRASLEDAAEQADNRVMRIAARQKLKELREDDLQKAGANHGYDADRRQQLAGLRDAAFADIQAELRKRLPHVDIEDSESRQQMRAAVTPEQNAAAVEAAVKDVAGRFIEHPLTAGKVDDALGGALQGHRMTALKTQGREKLEAIITEYKKANNIAAGGDRPFDESRRAIEGAYTVPPIDEALVKARRILEVSRLEKEANDKANTERQAEISNSVMPLSGVKAPSIAQKGVWNGNVSSPTSPFITDGHMMFDSAAIRDQKRLASLRAPKDATRKILDTASQKVWTEQVRHAIKRLEEIGHLQRDAADFALLSDQDGRQYWVSAPQYRFIQSLTGADSARGVSPERGLVLYKGEKPVALLMPFKQQPDIDLNLARKAVAKAAGREEPPATSSQPPAPNSEPASLASRIAPEAAPIWYSQLERTIEQKMPAKAGVGQVLGIVKNPQSGVKPDELKWTDLEGWLAKQPGVVTKEQVLDYLRANAVRLEEFSGARYGKYVLPGGKNYHELLLTLPPDLRAIERAGMEIVQTEPGRWGVRMPDGTWLRNAGFLNPTDAQNAALSEAGGAYESPHWSEPNVLAHVRFNDRTGPNGEKILHVEEIQSDWHEQGRKKGYRAPNSSVTAEFAREFFGIDKQKWELDISDADKRAYVEEATEQSQRNLVPDAPFAKTWHELAFRRALRWAAEHGYDKVTWTTGAQQAARYDLSKHASKISWKPPEDEGLKGTLEAWNKKGEHVVTKSIQPDELEEYLGKDAARRLQDQPIDESGRHVLEGNSLQIGGHGMSGFYDQILPQYASKYAKKWGASVEDARIGTPAIGLEAQARTAELRAQIELAKKQAEDKLGIHEGDERANIGNAPSIGGYRYSTGKIYSATWNSEGQFIWKMVGDFGGTRAGRSGKFERELQAEATTRGIQWDDHADARGNVLPQYDPHTYRRIEDERHQVVQRVRDLYGELQKLKPKPAGPRRIVHSISITPSMRESVMQGQPLFARVPELIDPARPHPSQRTGALNRQDVDNWIGASQSRLTEFEGMPVLLVNAPAADVVYQAKAEIGGGETSANVAGLALTRSGIRTLLEEAAVRANHLNDPDATPYDRALVAVAAQIRQATADAGFEGALPIVQAGSNMPADILARTIREEVDHARQYAVANRAMAQFLPPAFLDHPLAQKAAAALTRFGYADISKPAGAFAQNNRTIAGMEIGVRLMRPGRYTELGLTPEEAVELAAHYIESLEQSHGVQNAEKVTRQTREALADASRRIAAPVPPGRGPVAPIDRGGVAGTADAGQEGVARAPAPNIAQSGQVAPDPSGLPVLHLPRHATDRANFMADWKTWSPAQRAEYWRSPQAQVMLDGDRVGPLAVALAKPRTGKLRAARVRPGQDALFSRTGSINVPETGNNGDLFDEATGKRLQEDEEQRAAKLLHDQLTAQIASGGAARAARIKPAQNRGLFEEEEPESGSLFARRAVEEGVSGKRAGETVAFRSSREEPGKPELNDEGMLHTTPDERYSQYWGPHTQRLFIAPTRTLDLTHEFGYDEAIPTQTLINLLKSHGVAISPELAARLGRADGSEILQYFSQYGQRPLVDALQNAGFDSAKINEYQGDTGRSATDTILFDAKLARPAVEEGVSGKKPAVQVSSQTASTETEAPDYGHPLHTGASDRLRREATERTGQDLTSPPPSSEGGTPDFRPDVEGSGQGRPGQVPRALPDVRRPEESPAQPPATNPERGAIPAQILTAPIAATERAARAFAREDIVPKARAAVQAATGAWDDALKTFAPALRGPHARSGAGLVRELGSELDQRRDRAIAAMQGLKEHFYDEPAELGVHGLRIIDAIEDGNADLKGLSGEDRRFVETMRQLFEPREAEIRKLDLLQHFQENYFPHVWADPDAATTWVRGWSQKRPLAGSESFRKRRTIPTVREGLEEAHLTPAFDNPVDFVLKKLAEEDKSITAHMAKKELQERDLTEFVGVFDKAPEGWAQINDKLFTQYGPPTVRVTESFDQQLRERLENLAASLGIKHTRKVAIGGTRAGYTQEGSDEIVTRFGSPDSVIAHELGHQLQFRYHLDQLLKARDYPERTRELRALADLRLTGDSESTESFKQYVRSKDEKMANAIAALIYAPAAFKEVAPNTWDYLRDELWHIPALRPIFDVPIRTTMTLGQGEAQVPVGGLVTMGHWYSPEPLARILNNHLSPDLSSSDAYKAWAAVNRTANMVELGISWFHGLTTALNSSLSDMALGAERVLAGHPLKGAASAGRGVLPFVSMLQDFLKGTRLENLWDGTAQPQNAIEGALVDALKRGGGQARQDPYWTTSFFEGMQTQWRKGNVAGAGIRLPLALFESTIKPVMKYLVPRVKMGAFAKLAMDEMARHPDMTADEARQRFGAIWDSIDNRFGQLSQRNLFMVGWARGVMNAVVGRPGWNIGTLKEVGGGTAGGTGYLGDLGKFAWNRMSGKAGPAPELPHSTAYLLALFLGGALINALVEYALTGDHPRELMDLIAPRDGGTAEDGRPSRIILPLYLSKDIYNYATRFWPTVKAKGAPALQLASDLITNRDFERHKIYGEGSQGLGHYLGRTFAPYSIEGLLRNIERRESMAKRVLPFVGVMPAGRRMGFTPAEQRMAEYFDEHQPQTRPEENGRTQAKSEITRAMRLRDYARVRTLAIAASDSGKLTDKDIDQAIERAHIPPLVFEFKRLPVEQGIEVLRVANADERAKLIPLLVTKIDNAMKTRPPEQQTQIIGKLKTLPPQLVKQIIGAGPAE